MMRKYPRTRHLEGSRLQPGDHDLEAVPLSALKDGLVVVEEKLDGANAALSFEHGELRLQSRGHYLVGGPRERHFDLFKQWAHTHRAPFRERLGERYVVYGEWLYAKHTVYYDALPHWFLEFDVLDREQGVFLATLERRELLAGLPVASVPVLFEGACPALGALTALVRRSLYKSDRWRERLAAEAQARALDLDVVRRETDPSDDAEGLYVKLEAGGVVTGRFKWVRPTFLTSVIESETHWLKRPIVPNRLDDAVDIFAGGR
jgi:hypothetical protein